MPGYIRFAESRPQQVRDMLERVPVAYVPLGSLEWHGEHNPLGLDGLKAEGLLERTASVTGGVLFPAMYWGAPETVQFQLTFRCPSIVRDVTVGRMLRTLRSSGFRVVVMLSGHYPPVHIARLFVRTLLFNRKGGAVAMAFPEMAFAYELGYHGDHAGHWETSVMMALRPELVDLSVLRRGTGRIERPCGRGVQGKDPFLHSDPELGREVVEKVVSGLARLVGETLEQGNDGPYRALWGRYLRQGILTKEALRSILAR